MEFVLGAVSISAATIIIYPAISLLCFIFLRVIYCFNHHLAPIYSLSWYAIWKKKWFRVLRRLASSDLKDSSKFCVATNDQGEDHCNHMNSHSSNRTLFIAKGRFKVHKDSESFKAN